MYKKILISGAHGSACSLIKSMMTEVISIDAQAGTCHQSWTSTTTTNKDKVMWNHSYRRDIIEKNWNPNIIIYIKINLDNIVQICRRVVILDFIYTQDPSWIQKDWCWTNEKHDRLAGPDWPPYSNNIYDYPQFCLDEMTQAAYERVSPWLIDRTDFDYVLDTAEFFGESEPVTLQHCFNELGCKLDMDFIRTWREINNNIYTKYADLFSWTLNYVPPDGWVSAEETGYG